MVHTRAGLCVFYNPAVVETGCYCLVKKIVSFKKLIPCKRENSELIFMLIVGSLDSAHLLEAVPLIEK